MPMEEDTDVYAAAHRWDAKARREELTCKICGELIPYGEQVVYYERGLCARCVIFSTRMTSGAQDDCGRPSLTRPRMPPWLLGSYRRP